MFDGNDQPLSRGPCDFRNGDCNELCLPTMADDIVCACADGHVMQADNQTCFNPTPTVAATACTTDTLPTVSNGDFGQCVVKSNVKTCDVICRPTYGPTLSSIKCLPNGNWNATNAYTCTISVNVSFSFQTAPCSSDTSAVNSARASLIRNFRSNGICQTAAQNSIDLCNDPNRMTVSCSVSSGRKRRSPETEEQSSVLLCMSEENRHIQKREILSHLLDKKTRKKQAKDEMASFKDVHRKKRNPILHKIKNKKSNIDAVLLHVVKKDGEEVMVNRVKRAGNGLDVDIEVKAAPDTSDGSVEDSISKTQAKVQDVVNEIKMEVASGNVALEVDGQTYTADPGSFKALAVKYECPDGTIEIDGGCGEAPSRGGSNGTAVAIAVGVVVALLLLGAISLGGYMYCRRQRRNNPGQNGRLSDLTPRDNPVYDTSDIPPANTEYPGEIVNAYATAGLPTKAGPDGDMEAGALPEKAPPPTQWVTFNDGSKEAREQNVYEATPPSAPPIEYNMFVGNSAAGVKQMHET
ncbi:Hypp5757 [Branchiostoma lanceolatum]|uniref:Hypp5757 protein n=1 Tax=Branchiostoma lanceolatum TaxID=7740 RepID=A0A8J9VYR3_BRALA|nr:Hypp5757 [Branchiostoma lanceolatum]